MILKAWIPLAGGLWLWVGGFSLLLDFFIGSAHCLLMCRIGLPLSAVGKMTLFRNWLIWKKILSDATARETVIALSEYLRRIALRRFSRKECAGLVGRLG